jgi:sec-independent protein translocase protein TatB
MFPSIGASEYVLIAIVALVVVGPKDLPMLLRKLGQFMAKLRGMAAEFRASFDEMARQSELDELRKEVEAMRQGQMSHFSDIAADANSHVAEIDADLQRTATYDYTPPVIEPAKAPRARKPAAKTTIKAAPVKKATPPKAPGAKTTATKAAATKTAAKPRAKKTAE